jgi:hypothetical protein
MPHLHLEDVPNDVYESLQRLAETHRRPLPEEAIRLLRQGVFGGPASPAQAVLLADLRRRSFTPPAGTPDSVALLAEDRGR